MLPVLLPDMPLVPPDAAAGLVSPLPSGRSLLEPDEVAPAPVVAAPPVDEPAPVVADGADAEPCATFTLRASSVCWSRSPLACRLCCFWKFLRAARVSGPQMPSTLPASKPCLLSDCWICAISSWLSA